MSVSNHKSVGIFGRNLVLHFGHVKNLIVEKYAKNAKIYKYAILKIFMSTTSVKCQTSKLWHKNMPVGKTGL